MLEKELGYCIKSVSEKARIFIANFLHKTLVVPGARIELALPKGNQILSLARLPVPPPRHWQHSLPEIRNQATLLSEHDKIAPYADA